MRISLSSSWLRLCAAMFTAEVDVPEHVFVRFKIARFFFNRSWSAAFTAAYTAVMEQTLKAYDTQCIVSTSSRF